MTACGYSKNLDSEMSKYLIRDWMNNILYDGIEFDSFEEGWDYIYTTMPEPDEASPDWVDSWYDDVFVIEKGYAVTGRKEEKNMDEMIYLSDDGNWGDATNLIVFNPHDLPEDVYDEMVDDPEAMYDTVRQYLIDNGKEMR